MEEKRMGQTQKLAVSGMVMALYIALMYATQSFAFGQYQVRIATALYSTAYLFSFLVLPLGFANLMSNVLMGGLGLADALGGALVGLLTALACALIRRFRLNERLLFFPIALIPSLGVSIWLSALLGVPYWPLAASLLVGQSIAGVAGVFLAKSLGRVFLREK